MTNRTLKLNDRNKRIFRAMIELATQPNALYTDVSRAAIAENAWCPESLVSYHFGNMERVHTVIVEFAIKHMDDDNPELGTRIGLLRVVATAILNRHPLALALTPEIKARALAGAMASQDV